MATSGKKNKKVKRKAVPLQDFLGGDGAQVITAQITRVVAPASWADECDEDEIEYNRPLQAFSLPTAPRASRAMDDVPEEAPFIAHLSNLPYDVDDEDITEFFEEQEIESMRLPREDGRSRGYGYIEFKTRNDLIAALMMPDPHIRNRRIRIDVSTESDQKRGSGGRYGRDSGYGDTSNWRKEGGGGGGGGRDDEGRGGGRSYGMNRDSNRDWPSSQGEEGGNWRDNMKKRSDSPPPQQSMRRGGAYGGDRERGGDRDGGDRYGGGSRDRYMGRGSGGRYEDRPVARSENEPAERPKLVLQKRTLPLPEIVQVPLDGAEGEADTADAAADVAVVEERVPAKPLPAADIFGEAKPVDTAARESQLEERRERERLAREEAAEAARKERAAAAEAARAAALAATPPEANGADSGVATSPSSDGGDVTKDTTTAEEAQPAPVTSWRRKNNDDDAAAAGGDEEAGRRQSPDRRVGGGGGGGRREYNNRRDNNNDRDYPQRRNNDYNNQRDNRGRQNDGGYGRGGGGGGRDNYRGDDRPLRRNDNNATHDSGDDHVAAAPREPVEARMPKYKEPTNTKLATTNKYEFLDDEGSD